MPKISIKGTQKQLKPKVGCSKTHPKGTQTNLNPRKTHPKSTPKSTLKTHQKSTQSTLKRRHTTPNPRLQRFQMSADGAIVVSGIQPDEELSVLEAAEKIDARWNVFFLVWDVFFFFFKGVLSFFHSSTFFFLGFPVFYVFFWFFVCEFFCLGFLLGQIQESQEGGNWESGEVW